MDTFLLTIITILLGGIASGVSAIWQILNKEYNK